MVDTERMQPVHVIVASQETTLRSLLQAHQLLERVERGNTIVLSEGKSLTDLDQRVPPGTKLAVIALEVLGGG